MTDIPLAIITGIAIHKKIESLCKSVDTLYEDIVLECFIHVNPEGLKQMERIILAYDDINCYFQSYLERFAILEVAKTIGEIDE